MYRIKEFYNHLNKKDKPRFIIGLASFLIICFWHLLYKDEYNIMDDVFNLFFTMFFVGYVFYEWSRDTTNKELKSFFVFMATIRSGSFVYILGHILFKYETVFGGPHLILIFITMFASIIISKKELILRYFKKSWRKS